MLHLSVPCLQDRSHRLFRPFSPSSCQLSLGASDHLKALGERLLQDVPKDVMMATFLKDDAEKACDYAQAVQEAKSKKQSLSHVARVEQHVARTAATKLENPGPK